MKRASLCVALCATILVAALVVSYIALSLRSSRAALVSAKQTSSPQKFDATRLGIVSIAAGQPPTGTEPSKSATLISRSRILDGNGPFSFPEKIVSGPAKTLYLLDTELSNVFLVNSATGAVTALCSPRLPARASDLSVDKSGNVWILDQRAQQLTSFNQQCRPRASFKPRSYASRVQLNAFGEVVLLTAGAQTLFEIYSPDGRFLRSFGQGFDYQDSYANAELNSGHMLPDSVGGFYFSFNYPPLLRHYARDGRLLAEFKPELNVPIERPEVSSRVQGTNLSISSKYQKGVLDMALDPRGRLVLLMSGENNYQALNNGSRNLLVTSARGQTLAKFELDAPFNRLAAANGLLYLLRNRAPLRLDKFALP